jgi:V/A-type H+-transporting ATPase subunit I
LLRPFELLVTAYGLPKYLELEPTFFVAISYLLMFGMMFGDVGHGAVLALGGLAALLAGRKAQTRDVGLLLLLGGCSSMIFGALYGSCFGLPQFKKYALWHDPLEGNPMSLMSGAVEIGIVMISLGLVLNVLNHFRRGDFIGGLLDKFGLAGVVFYWGALALFVKSPAFASRGLTHLAVILFLVLPVIGWMLKEPINKFLGHHAGHPGEAGGGIFTAIMESVVEVFEAVLSYFANTVSFVRLAAYAMSHAALLVAAFMIAADVKHFSHGGNLLSVLVIILGNLVALVLEGIVASVQALRLEYYEFFGKFFSGSGQPFKPFRLFPEEKVSTG